MVVLLVPILVLQIPVPVTLDLVTLVVQVHVKEVLLLVGDWWIVRDFMQLLIDPKCELEHQLTGNVMKVVKVSIDCIE